MDSFSEKRRRRASTSDWRGQTRIRPGVDTVSVIDHSGRKIFGLRLVVRRPHGGFHQAVEYRGVIAEDPDIYTGSAHDSAMLWEARRKLLTLAENHRTKPYRRLPQAQ